MALKFTVPVVRDETDDVTLTDTWCLERRGSDLVICFVDSDKVKVDEWIVHARIESRLVEASQTERARVRGLRVLGRFDAAETAVRGAPVSSVARFSDGFPEDWKNLVAQWPSSDIAEASKDEESDEESAPRRSKRIKTHDGEKPFFDEDEMLLRALRKAEDADNSVDILGLYEEDMSSDDNDDELEDEVSSWSNEEVAAFHTGRLMLDSMADEFWESLSKFYVKTRSADECRIRWVYEASRSDEKRGQRNVKGGFSEEDALNRAERAAKVGTLKFRKQVRSEWERVHVKQQRDNLTTPFREKLNESNLPIGHFSDVKTPAPIFAFGKHENKKPKQRLTTINDDSDTEEKQDDAPSPDVLIQVNRDNLDEYLIGLVKERKKLSNHQLKFGTRKARESDRLDSRTAEAEMNGVRGVMTPGGGIRVTVDESLLRGEDSEEKIDDDADSVW